MEISGIHDLKPDQLKQAEGWYCVRAMKDKPKAVVRLSTIDVGNLVACYYMFPDTCDEHLVKGEYKDGRPLRIYGPDSVMEAALNADDD